MNDKKLIACPKECLNWDENINDCVCGHDVYQSALGVLYVPAGCEDYEPIDESDSIDEFLGSYANEGDEELYIEDEPEEEGYVDEGPDYGYYEEEPVRSVRKRRPVRESRESRKRPVAKPEVRSDRPSFGERAKQRMEEAKRKKQSMKPPVEKTKAVKKEYDPLDELREDQQKKAGSILGELRSFREQVESGAITPEQIKAEIESVNKMAIEAPELTEAQLEEVRRKAGVSKINAKIKKPEAKTTKKK